MRANSSCGIVLLALLTGLRTAAAMDPPAREDMEKMKREGTYAQGVEAAKEMAGHKPSPALIEKNAQGARVSWDGDTAVYEDGGWALMIDYLNRGTRSEGQNGRLFHNGTEVQPSGVEVLETPLGTLNHWGTGRQKAWDVTGWNFDAREKFRPSSLISEEAGKSISVGGVTGRNYRYFYKGALVTLRPSRDRVAIAGDAARIDAFLSSPAGVAFQRDPLTDRGGLKEKGLTVICRAPQGTKEFKGWGPMAADLSMADKDAVVQPVFEQGQAVLIPTDEVIVGFRGDTTLDQARSSLSGEGKQHAIADVRSHRQNAFIVKIRKAADGGAFCASRALASQAGVAYAEPNLITIMNQ